VQQSIVMICAFGALRPGIILHRSRSYDAILFRQVLTNFRQQLARAVSFGT